jgi:hypothetical protein
MTPQTWSAHDDELANRIQGGRGCGSDGGRRHSVQLVKVGVDIGLRRCPGGAELGQRVELGSDVELGSHVERAPHVERAGIGLTRLAELGAGGRQQYSRGERSRSQDHE